MEQFRDEWVCPKHGPMANPESKLPEGIGFPPFMGNNHYCLECINELFKANCEVLKPKVCANQGEG